MTIRVDLNCDLGEYSCLKDETKECAIMPYITSANIASGGHIGDKHTIRNSVKRAMDANVGIGVHPSFEDRDNFGRVEMDLSTRRLKEMIRRQLDVFMSESVAVGGAVSHIKAHGALYNMAARDVGLASAFCETVLEFDDALVVYGLANSCWIEAGENVGIRVVAEGFADRRYSSSASLVSRSIPTALIVEPETAVLQVLDILLRGAVKGTDGSTEYPVRAETICIHGDSDGALDIAKALREALPKKDISIKKINDVQF